MKETTIRILLAVDGSDQSLAAVRYVASLLAAKKVELVLFYLLNKIPEAMWDLERYPGYGATIYGMHAWTIHQKKAMERFMEVAVGEAVDAGISRQAIVTRIQERKVGVARDLIYESQQGFDAIVVGRAGMGGLKGLVLGGVGNKLLSKAPGAPLWLIGGNPVPGKVLIALDNSDCAMRAVEYAGNILKGTGSAVMLVHVARAFDVFVKENSDTGSGDSDKSPALPDPNHIKAAMETVFEKAEAKLVSAGVKPDKITTKIVMDVPSRAGAIVELAKQNKIGTIVAGRRGLSFVEDFFIGRVSNKIVQLAREMAVWIVN